MLVSAFEAFSLKINKHKIFRFAQASKYIFRQPDQGLFFNCDVGGEALCFKTLGNLVGDNLFTGAFRLTTANKHTGA